VNRECPNYLGGCYTSKISHLKNEKTRAVIPTGNFWQNLSQLEGKHKKFTMQLIYNWYRNLLRHPMYRWWVILGTLIYIFSPIDIVPDFIPIFGQLDDVVILSVLFSEVSALVMAAMKGSQNSDKSSSETIDVDAVSVD
jgi:uncharacterized membrane protein YkvA (DUF1232 family)